MLILNARGCVRVVKGEFQKLDYTVLVEGQMYKVSGRTAKGSLILKPANGFTVPVHTPGSALAEFAHQARAASSTQVDPAKRHLGFPVQTHGPLLTNQPRLEMYWPKLNLKVQKFMYYKPDGTPTTPQERNELAAELTTAVGVSEACAWNWSKDHAPKPHRKNLVGIAQFFAKRGE